MGKDEDSPRRVIVPEVLRIDALCDQYEDEWQAGRVPNLAVYLAKVDEADQPALRHALARLDAVYDRASNEQEATPSDAVPLKLVVTDGPHTGKEFVFDGHDTFLVGRSKSAHFQLSY